MRTASFERGLQAGPQRGLTTVEYAVAGGLITAALVLSFLLLGPAIASAINAIANLF